jgi:hypothetical protein
MSIPMHTVTAHYATEYLQPIALESPAYAWTKALGHDEQ